MIDYHAAVLSALAVHQVGNRTSEDGVRFSEEETVLSEGETMDHLKQYFLSSFNNVQESYHLTHVNGIELNEVYNFCSRIFDDPAVFFEQSKEIAKHLYERSLHPRIKPGEVSVCLFEKINFEGEDRRAIGIFKAENRNVFLQFVRGQGGYRIDHQLGVDVEKLEKGVLIYDMEKENGFRLSIIDPQRSGDAQYWKNEFLMVRSSNDSYHQTKDFLSVTKEFVTKQFSEEFNVGKTDQIDLLNRSVEYFKSHDAFDQQEFEQEVFHHENLIESFRRFGETMKREHDLEIGESFDISANAVKKQARVFKSVLKLDKNFHIYIHGNRDLIEQGVDEQGRKFYKIFYFNES